MRDMWLRKMHARAGTMLVALALAGCAITDLVNDTADMTNPPSGILIDYRTSFVTMPGSSVLALVHSASTMLYYTDDATGRVCFGLSESIDQKSRESACLRFADIPKWKPGVMDAAIRNPHFTGPIFNPQFDHRVGAALVRECGQYPWHSEDELLESGAGCGLLGAFLALDGNASAAKTVWEQAGGCHTRGALGDPTNNCMRFIIGVGDTDKEGQQWLGQTGYDHRDLYADDKPRLISMAKAACLSEFDYASCAFLHLTIGVKMDMEALRHAVQDRQAAIRAQRDDTNAYPQATSGFLAKSEVYNAERKSKEAEQSRARLERTAKWSVLVRPLLTSQ